MLRTLVVIAVVAACGRGSSREDPPQPAPSPAPVVVVVGDPHGPCATFPAARDRDHGAQLNDAARGKPVRLETSPLDSGRLTKVGAQVFHVVLPRAHKLDVAVEDLGTPPTKLATDRWECTADGWMSFSGSHGSFQGAERGTSGSTTWEAQANDTELLLAITADPPSDFRVVITAK